MSTRELSDPQYFLHRLERLLERALFDGVSVSDDHEAEIWLVRLALEAHDQARAESLVSSLERLVATQPGRGTSRPRRNALVPC